MVRPGRPDAIDARARHRVRHRLEHLGAAHAVDHGVVHLAEERRAPAGEPIDQVRLPQGTAGVERRGEERVDQLVQLGLAAGRRHGDVAEMAAHVEGRVLLPAWPVEVEERPDRALAVAGDRAEALDHRRREGLERDRAVEQRDAADVHTLVGLLEVEESRVEGRETLRTRHGHPPLAPKRVSSAADSSKNSCSVWL